MCSYIFPASLLKDLFPVPHLFWNAGPEAVSLTQVLARFFKVCEMVVSVTIYSHDWTGRKRSLSGTCLYYLFVYYVYLLF